MNESYSQTKSRQAKSQSDDGPASTPCRRQFMKKAAIATAAAGIGGTLIGKAVIPESSAKSSGRPLATDPCVETNTTNVAGNLVVWESFCACCPGFPTVTDTPCQGLNSTAFGAHLSGIVDTVPACVCPCCPNCLGATLIIDNTACEGIFCPVGLGGLTEGTSTSCWPSQSAGVVGSANTGVGVSGSSKSGIGVLGYAISPCSTPIAAFGASSQSANIQEWISPGHPESVVANNGFFGIGTTAPKTVLDVNGVISGSHLGVGTTSPKTTLDVNGSVSAKTITKTGTSTLSKYPMATTDFAVLVNASVLPTGVTTFIVTLPPAKTAIGMIVFIKKIDPSAHTVTVDGAGSGSTQDKIEGVTSMSLAKQFNSLTLFSNGGAPPGTWYILANSI
jgi:hypothetical protein